jgi:hypothetical protein
MNSAMAKSALIAVPLLLLLCALAWWNPRTGTWVGVEPPKAQVEAYDASKLRSATHLSSTLYDEAKLTRLFREPQNTVSNLAFVAAGLAVYFAGRRQLTRSFAVGCLFLGVGSGLYHASLLPEWRLIDILGVYVVLFSLLGLGFAASICRPARESWVAAAIWIAAIYAGIRRNDVRIMGLKVLDSTYVVVGAVVLLAALCLWSFRRTTNTKHYFLLAAVLTAVGALAAFGGLADRFGGVWANPEAFVQGHSVWHALGAVALLAAYEIFSLTGYDTSIFAKPGELDVSSG